MGYQNYNKNYNGEKKFNNNRGGYKPQQNDRPKNKTMTFPVLMSGSTPNGRTYDVNGALASLETLRDNNTFSMLSVPVSVSRALLENDADRRGSSNVGFIKDLSIADMTVDVVVYGKIADRLTACGDLTFVPRMLVKDEKVITFVGFDLVATAE